MAHAEVANRMLSVKALYTSLHHAIECPNGLESNGHPRDWERYLSLSRSFRSQGNPERFDEVFSIRTPLRKINHILHELWSNDEIDNQGVYLSD